MSKTDELNNGKLVDDIEAISGTFYLNEPNCSSSEARNQPTAEMISALMTSPKSKNVSRNSSPKDKKSIWNWKPLKALSHVRNRRFNCGFTLEVHRIEGLPSEFNGLTLSVHWKRRDGKVATKPIKVVEGVVEFEEKLVLTCSVYGSRKGTQQSAKYEAKHFCLYVEVNENPKLDLGKQRIDLTRLLPHTLEELDGEKGSGTWCTSFKLSGSANGAVLNVTFGYLVLGDNVAPNNKNVLKLLDSKAGVKNKIDSNQGDGKGPTRHSGSFPTKQKSSVKSHSVDEVKVLREVTPVGVSDFSTSLNTLFQKFDDEESSSLGDDVEPVKSAFFFPLDLSTGAIANENEHTDKCEIAASSDDVEPVKSVSFSPSDLSTEVIADENERADFSIIDKGIESSEERLELENQHAKYVDQSVLENPDLPSSCSRIQDDHQEESDLTRDIGVMHDLNSEEKEGCTKESLLEDLRTVLNHVANLEKEASDTPKTKSESSDLENEVEDKPNGKTQSESAGSVSNLEKEVDSLKHTNESSDQENEVEDNTNGKSKPNLDDVAASVADEFISMLGIEDSPISFSSNAEAESPRERLLREFEKEVEASGCPLFDFGMEEEVVSDYVEADELDRSYHAPTVSGLEECSDVPDSVGFVEPESPEIRAKVKYEYPKIRARVVEDLETEELPEEWGLDEKTFESSSPNRAVVCHSPTSPSFTEPPSLPPLGEGLGSFIKTKTGGFLRSMNPLLFSNSKSGGSLIMQVSSPVVVPAELGSGVMETLQNLASVGLEKLSMQANKLMPLEEISGKSMQQIAWEGAQQEASERQNMLDDKKMTLGDFARRKSKQADSNFTTNEIDTEYVSLEDLAPLAMDKIEALSIEGLRIQCGMTEEEAPSNISAKSVGKFSPLKGIKASSSGSMGFGGAVGLQLLNIKESEPEDIDGLMNMSLTLDEWMRLDCGEIDEDQKMNERTSKLLAAHHANITDLNILGKGEKKQGKASRRSHGLLGNNFTVALMVQLHDPLRNYEPVGTPMLALIQVERVFLPPKLKIYIQVAEARDSDDEDDQLEFTIIEGKNVESKEEKTQEQDLIPQFKINEVHVAGFKTEPDTKKSWGTSTQQQSGSRWLLANGMGKKSIKHPLIKPKIATKSCSQPHHLWSISSRFVESEAKLKDVAIVNPHVRNPNIIFPNETIRLP